MGSSQELATEFLTADDTVEGRGEREEGSRRHSLEKRPFVEEEEVIKGDQDHVGGESGQWRGSEVRKRNCKEEAARTKVPLTAQDLLNALWA